MHDNYLEYIGYVASVVIAISMTMRSIVKFRWINLAGAILFSTYGFVIGSLPVGLLNGFIVVVDMYYLYQIYGKQEQVFEILEVAPDSRYLLRFLDFHRHDIQKFFQDFSYIPDSETKCYLTLRDMAVSGVFLAHTETAKELNVALDYVLPEYRDFKNGRFVYGQLNKKLAETGVEVVRVESSNPAFIKYLKKLGFTKAETVGFERYLR
jgi:hypothetical protein